MCSLTAKMSWFRTSSVTSVLHETLVLGVQLEVATWRVRAGWHAHGGRACGQRETGMIAERLSVVGLDFRAMERRCCGNELS